MIYLDNAATTQPLKQLKNGIDAYWESEWFNPSALYAPAAKAHKKLSEAREILKKALGSPNFEVLFTASGTESDVTAILCGARKRKTMHFITDSGEHAAVFEAFARLSESGCDVTIVDIDEHGTVDPQSVAYAVREDTALVSIMHVNNETGAVNDIEAISRGVKAKNRETLFHSDGVQAFLRVYANLENVDYYSVSAHKIHALKGVGALFYRKNAPIKPYIVGGGQESGLRSGTENTFGIAAFAAAAEYFSQNKNDFAVKLASLKHTFVKGLKDLDGVRVISPENGASHIVSVTIENVRGEVLLHSLEVEGDIYFHRLCVQLEKRREPHGKEFAP